MSYIPFGPDAVSSLVGNLRETLKQLVLSTSSSLFMTNGCVDNICTAFSPNFKHLTLDRSSMFSDNALRSLATRGIRFRDFTVTLEGKSYSQSDFGLSIMHTIFNGGDDPNRMRRGMLRDFAGRMVNQLQGLPDVWEEFAPQLRTHVNNMQVYVDQNNIQTTEVPVLDAHRHERHHPHERGIMNRRPSDDFFRRRFRVVEVGMKKPP